jgi:methylated-DNA-protein-cysteine methyltransferase-like protein
MAPRFFSPPDPHGFNAQVWTVVRRIPEGSVCPYGAIARLLPPLPGISARDLEVFGARWVGGAMAACPEGVPWHRVINAQGKISMRDEHARQRQRALLEAEGIVFDDRERIDLSVYGWDGMPGHDV